MYLLDTNVVSELRKAGTNSINVDLETWEQGIESGHLYVTSNAALELEIGVQRIEWRDRRQGKVLRSWLDDRVVPSFHGRVLAFDVSAATYGAGLHVPDQRSDRDSFIAAIAFVHDIFVVTRNTKDFEGMGVQLLNPWLKAQI